MSAGPARVLIVDEGVSFGGSVLVGAVVAGHMPPARYQVSLAASVHRDVLRLDAAAVSRVFYLKKPYDYVVQSRFRTHFKSLPSLFRRAAGFLDLFIRFAINSGYVLSVAAAIRRSGTSILHLNNGFQNLEAHLAGRLSGCRILIHAHGPCGNSRLTQYLARRCGGAVAVSEGVAQSLAAAGVPDDRLTVIPNPLTVTAADPGTKFREAARRRHHIPPGATVAAIVGRIIAWKGQLEFLRAAAVALRADPAVVAVVIGDVTDGNEAYGRELHAEAERLGIVDRVHFTGFIADPSECFGLIDILVHSSIEAEPFGLVVTEAMAFGLPVIAATTGGPAEIITDGVDGFLRDPRDPESVGSTLAMLVQDRAERQRVGEAGRATVLARYGVDQYTRRLAETYDRLLEEPGRGSLTDWRGDSGPDS